MTAINLMVKKKSRIFRRLGIMKVGSGFVLRFNSLEAFGF